MNSDRFLRALRHYDEPNVFNPYRHSCPLYDGPNAPKIRQRNLRRALDAACTNGVAELWIGRDPGYRGARRTGLALTDEVHLPFYEHAHSTAPLHCPTTGPIVAEQTAARVWEVILQLAQPPFLWNAFPFHPHNPDQPMSNRAHTRSEFRSVAWVLESLVTILNPSTVVAIGRDAETALIRLSLPHVTVRHPARGGARRFKTALQAMHGLPPS